GLGDGEELICNRKQAGPRQTSWIVKNGKPNRAIAGIVGRAGGDVNPIIRIIDSPSATAEHGHPHLPIGLQIVARETRRTERKYARGRSLADRRALPTNVERTNPDGAE